jgi:hypothetical protein
LNSYTYIYKVKKLTFDSTQFGKILRKFKNVCLVRIDIKELVLINVKFKKFFK